MTSLLIDSQESERVCTFTYPVASEIDISMAKKKSGDGRAAKVI